MSDFYTDTICPPLLVPDRPAIDMRRLPLGIQCQTVDGRNMILRYVEEDLVFMGTSHRAAQVDCFAFHPRGTAVRNGADGPGVEDDDLDLATLHVTTSTLRVKSDLLALLPQGTRLPTKGGRWVQTGAHDAHNIVGWYLVTKNEAMPPEIGRNNDLFTHTGSLTDHRKDKGLFKLDLTKIVPPVWQGLDETRARMRAERTKQVIANLDSWE